MPLIFSILARLLNSRVADGGRDSVRLCSYCHLPLSGPTSNGMHLHCAEDHRETSAVESRSSGASNSRMSSTR